MIDPIWWFYLFWIPDYLQREHGLHLTAKSVYPSWCFMSYQIWGALPAVGFHRV